MSQIPAQHSAAALSLLIDGARYPEPSVQAALETARVRVAEPFLHSARAALRNTDDGLRMGAMLNDLKAQLPYGEFDKFVERMGIKKNTANRWMRLARGGPQRSPHNAVQKTTTGFLQPDVVGSIGTAKATGPALDLLDESELMPGEVHPSELEPELSSDVEGFEDDELFDDEIDEDEASIGEQISALQQECREGIDRIDALLQAHPGPDGRGAQGVAATAGAVSAPSAFSAVDRPAVQLTLAGEYEAIDRTRRAFDELVQGVLARVRDGRVSLTAGHRMADVLEAAGMEIQELVNKDRQAGDGVADHAVQAV